MTRIGAVSFEHVQGPQFYCVTAAELPPRTPMVAPTRFGLALGALVLGPYEAEGPLPEETARPATGEERRQDAANRDREAEALAVCRDLVREHDLPMKLARAFWSLDRRHLTFFYGAPGRVDFRQLLRDLVRTFRSQIRLEQIGERDVARLLGGVGRCGRECCCAVWLPQFEPISMGHAREQGLPPVPSQLAGCCGRLRCCLRYELDGGPCGECRHDQRPVKTASYWADDEVETPR